jgi:hypothetical protein
MDFLFNLVVMVALIMALIVLSLAIVLLWGLVVTHQVCLP